ncbi:MAG: hypothetical protein CMF80_05860 [Candidatus Marinimicrobia bacterium]|nr:hypothetical protein [Candidatus Neomarinimicrobiota bacterium]|tara:strand:+ start:705 stop:3698 length:2994 start_codon:yes stop_codon:yes gene_type:complete
MPRLIDDYFMYIDKLEKTYGKEKTLVLIHCGDFYEVYGLKDPKTGEIFGSNIIQFSKTLDMEIGIKTKMEYQKNMVVMCGFPVNKGDHHCQRLYNAGFTIAIYEQSSTGSNCERKLKEIISPGTYLGIEDTPHITNHFMCVWIEKTTFRTPKLHFGLSTVDIFTGENILFEYHVGYQLNSSPYNELERFLISYSPKQIIFIYDIPEDEMKKVLKYLSNTSQIFHLFNRNSHETDPIRINQIKNSEKQTYQNSIIQKYFNSNMIDSYSKYAYALQSYCFLLEFIYEHNPSIVTKIKSPVFQNSTERVLLENHSLKQLNIIGNEELVSNSKKNSSVSKFLNVCKTNMGKRLLHESILNPIKNVKMLAEFYDRIDAVLQMDKNILPIDTIRNKLTEVIDIEILNRKIIKNNVTPCDISSLFYSLVNLEELFANYKKGIDSIEVNFCYIKKFERFHQSGNVQELISLIDKHIDIKKAMNITTNDYSIDFISRGFSKEHDQLIHEYNGNCKELDVIIRYLNTEMEKVAKKINNKDMIEIDVKKEETNIIITVTRFKKLITHLREQGYPRVSLSYENEDDIVEFELDTNSLDASDAKKANYYIKHQDINTLCETLDTNKQKVIESTKKQFGLLIQSLQTIHEKIISVCEFTSNLDLDYSKAFLSKKYNYVKPIIQDESERSFVSCHELRHPIIENLNMNETYVPNDIKLCNTQTGILLYGTNAVGKSSLIKSIGISLIMAQSGFYVPATSFNFSPYHSIFTRILGNDNLFKGLSTFAVEILELSTILEYADSNSLVIGDEVCSGTEIESATSLIVSTLQHLHKQNTSFIFATHFHEICHYEEIKNLDKLKIKHLSVTYNAENESLEYDRILKDGQGDTYYGLTVAEAYKLPKNILLNARNIRTKYLVNKEQQRDNILNLKQSIYNSNQLFGDICEMCKKNKSSEVHHLRHQKYADDNGFIGYLHKNSLGNVMCICEKCHQKIHQEDIQHIKKKTTKGNIFKEI